MEFLNPSDSSVYFVNDSFLFVETRVKYLFSFISPKYPSTSIIIKYKRFTQLIFTYSESFTVM